MLSNTLQSILSKTIGYPSILICMHTMPKKGTLSMEMQSVTLWSKLKARSFANLSPWTTEDSNTIIAIFPQNTWMQKTEMKISRRKGVGEWSCTGWPKLSTPTPLSVESFLQSTWMISLMLPIKIFSCKRRAWWKIDAKRITTKSSKPKTLKMHFSLLKCMRI